MSLVSTNANASASSPSLASVTTQMDETLNAHGRALNELASVIVQLEQRLVFFLHAAPPANANEKSASARPKSSNPVIAFLESSTEEIEGYTGMLKSLTERLPT